MISLFSSLSKSWFTFSKKQQVVNIYLCGPTVYEHVHIGNLRSVVFFALLTKLLKLEGFTVNYYQNITDIDDKIVQKAKKRNQSEVKVSTFYFLEYQKILTKLQLDLPQFVKVTDHISQIIDCIKRLMDNNFAYQTSDGVYFDTDKISDYKKLTKNFSSNLPPHQGKMRNGQYCCLWFAHKNSFLVSEKSTTKKNCHHFALWKFKKTGQSWNSPWGVGRPGWHTECVSLIDFLFGLQLDLHGGGYDLVFPHHHNQMAQFLALNPQAVMTKFWWHNGLVHIARQKISKSKSSNFDSWIAKNFLKTHNANILKLIFYFGIYHLDLQLNARALKQVYNFDQKIKNILQKMQYKLVLISGKVFSDFNSFDSLIWDQLFSVLTKNLAVHLVLDQISHLIKRGNIFLKANNVDAALPLVKTVFKFLCLINLHYLPPSIDEENKAKLLQWQDLITKKQFLQADQIRQQLQKVGILPGKGVDSETR